MRRKHSNKPFSLNCKIRKNWRETVCHFCQFGRTSLVNLAKGFGAPNLNITSNSRVINVLYQSHFDLKFYPRSSKLEDPLKVTRVANLHARQRHHNNSKSFISWIQKHCILIDRGRRNNLRKLPKFYTVFSCKLTTKLRSRLLLKVKLREKWSHFLRKNRRKCSNW